MSEFKDFICNSIVKPRTITYGERTITCIGEIDFTHLYINSDKGIITNMSLDLSEYDHIIIVHVIYCTDLRVYEILKDTCDGCKIQSYYQGWFYDSWKQVDRLMKKLIEIIH